MPSCLSQSNFAIPQIGIGLARNSGYYTLRTAPKLGESVFNDAINSTLDDFVNFASNFVDLAHLIQATLKIALSAES
jgi:hypothetical protein